MDNKARLLEAYIGLQQILNTINHACVVFMVSIHALLDGCNDGSDVIPKGLNPFHLQIEHINHLVRGNENHCISQLRMDRRAFLQLCIRLQNEGELTHSKHVTLEEKTATSLKKLAHHTKNRIVGFDFRQSGQTISKHFNDVIRGILRLQHDLLATPESVSSNSTDHIWKYFENCLGALDGTYVRVHVRKTDAPKYRTRKGYLAKNVLEVCNQNMMFIYVLSGWKGSAADSRVVRDAVARQNELRVPNGCYYLVDTNYTNGNGFLAPYMETHYHLNLWREDRFPRSKEEFFNLKYYAARNIIERCFGLLKLRWSILRSPSFYPIKTQFRIVIACCLLHNHIRKVMNVDPMEAEFDEQVPEQPDGEPIGMIEPSNEWTNWRDEFSEDMYNDWLETRAGRQ